MKQALSRLLLIAMVGAAGCITAASAGAATIVDEWGSVKADAAPALKPATIDPKTTAVLVMDMVTNGCSEKRRPRCVASVNPMVKFLTEARGKGVTIINTVAGNNTAANILPPLASKAGEPLLTGTGPDKFIGTDLEKMLKDKGITTVVPMGTAAHGAVLYTGSSAALRGFKVILPVDGMSSETPYGEQAVTWLFANAPRVSGQTTLTSFGMIKF